MTNRLQLGIVALIAQALAGCGPDAVRSSVPTAPSSTPPPAVTTGRQRAPWPAGVFDPNIILAGVVFEVVQDKEIPIEGAWIYCELCTEETHAGMYTDNKGVYSFKGVWAHSLPILVGKDGYQDPPGTTYPSAYGGLGWREVIVNGDTRFNIQLARK